MQTLKGLSNDVQNVIHRMIHRDKLQRVHSEFKEKTAMLLKDLHNTQCYPESNLHIAFCERCKSVFVDFAIRNYICDNCWMIKYMLPEEDMKKWGEVYNSEIK